MKTVLTAALIALFALGAPCVVIAADDGEQVGSATESTNTNTEEEKARYLGHERSRFGRRSR